MRVAGLMVDVAGMLGGLWVITERFGPNTAALAFMAGGTLRLLFVSWKERTNP